jgi:hypothetical protein
LGSLSTTRLFALIDDAAGGSIVRVRFPKIDVSTIAPAVFFFLQALLW